MDQVILSNGWNTTISSMRFRNSGLKDRRSSPITSSFLRPSCPLFSSFWNLERDALLDQFGADVRRHDNDGVLEIHLPAETIREDAVVQHLESTLNTSGCAFSISSNTTGMADGVLFLRQLPPSSYPRIREALRRAAGS